MNVAIIPAKGSSSRIPGKNKRLFHGKPMIAYSIETAKASELFEHVVVSTDDAEIANISLSLGAGIVWRDAELTGDEVGTQEVTADALRRTPRAFDHACCIYPCVPMLTAADLCVGLEIFCTPYRYVYVNGWFYWGDVRDFGENPSLEASFEMDRLIGDRWIDINTPDDWSRAEQMYASLHS